MPSLQERLKRAKSREFVGREEPIRLLRKNLSSKVPDYPLLQISGQGGVGKTTLLNYFQMICDAVSVPHGLTNEVEKAPLEAMHRLAEQLDKTGYSLKAFSKRYQTYLQLQGKIEQEPDLPKLLGELFGKAVGTGTVVVGRSTPLTSALLDLVGSERVEDQANALSRYLFQKIRNQDDVQLMMDPTAQLSPLFVADLSRIAEEQQVVLMFDTVEETEAYLLPWLKDLIEGRYGSMSESVSFIFAGRAFDAQSWLPVQPLLTCCNLEPFTIEETKKYLESKGLIDSEEIHRIHDLSGGLPLFVAMLNSLDISESGTATRSVVERFLRDIAEPTHRHLVLQLALARRFDQDLVMAIVPPEIERATVTDLFAWITKLPFVQAQRNYWIYHPLLRAHMIVYQRSQSVSEFRETHQKLAIYHQQQAEAGGLQASDCWRNYTVWWPDYLEATYHALCANPYEKLSSIKVDLAIIFLHLFFDERAILEWTDTLAAASTDLGGHESISALASLVREVSIAFSSGELKKELENAFNLYDLLCQSVDAEMMPQIKAWLHYFRAIFHMALTRRQAAIADYSEAIILNPMEAIFFLQRGVTYFTLQDFEQAIADLSAAIKLNPEESDAYYLRGAIYSQLDDSNQALDDYNKTINLNPQDATSFYLRGRIYAELGKYEGAIADLSEAIHLRLEAPSKYQPPDLGHFVLRDYEQASSHFGAFIRSGLENNSIFCLRGRVYYLLEQFEQAISDLNEAVRLQPKDADAYEFRGRAFLMLRKFEQAIADFSEVIRHKPEDADILDLRGNAYAMLESYELAINDFSEAIRYNRENAATFVSRGRAYDAIADHEKAIADYDTAIRLNPEEATTYYFRGSAYTELKDLQHAVADFDAAIQLNPEDADVFYQRGRIYSELGSYERAITDYSEAIRLDPKLTAAYLYRGMASLNQNDYRLAISDFSMVIRARRGESLAFFGRGAAFEKLGNLERALADYSTGIRFDPNNDTLYYRRGVTYYSQHNYKQALADLSDAVRLNSQHFEALCLRGIICEGLGDSAQAVADFSEAIKLNPTEAKIHYLRGRNFAWLKNYEQAIADYTEATKLDPSYFSPFYGLACIHAARKDTKAMLPMLRTCLELDREECLRQVSSNPDFDPVRDNPHFRAMLAKFSS